MPTLNKVLLIGNVGRDPEVRYLDQGSAQGGQSTKVATFTLATTDRYRDRGGELRETTEWHNLVLWRQLADLAERYIRKGSQIYVEGHIRTRSYTDQQGLKKYMTEIVADNVQLLGRRDGEGDVAPASAQGGYGQGGYRASQQGGYQAPAYQAPAPAASAGGYQGSAAPAGGYQA
ncbi:MAG: single-stranded DNA-binding protein, partial [Bacteroidales bacterium]|nr:single-stranded DNA-binding protein [Bacteroidales bacterium]